MIFDSHSHLQFKVFEDKTDVIEKCLDKNMIINIVGTQKNTSKKAVELAQKYENFYASIGLHPIHLFSSRVDEEESSFISREENFDEKYYTELLNSSKKIIAVGECGIDLYHLPDAISKEKVLEKQKQVLKDQIKFARENDLPLVLHVRDGKDSAGEAYEELYKVLKEYDDIRGIVHCFSGNSTQAKKYLDLGLYLGFTGIITYPKIQESLLEVLEKVDLDKILIETDAPYLAPQKYRGKMCEPWMVEENLKFIARLRNIDESELEKILDKNRLNLFNKIKN